MISVCPNTKTKNLMEICLQLQLQLQYFIVSIQYIYETLTISDISFIQTLIRKREKERKKERKEKKIEKERKTLGKKERQRERIYTY